MIKLHFTTITPLHIANGEQLGFGLDYVIRNEAAFSKLDFRKVADYFADNRVVDFSKSYSLDSLIDLIYESKKHLPEDCYSYKVLITPSFNKVITSEGALGQKFVSEFINSSGKFYIPASSVKGMLRTILGSERGIGIDVTNPNMNDRFVICDSNSIPQESFNIFATNNRPPSVNLMCLKMGINFEMIIKRTGCFKIPELKNKLREYSHRQVDLAIKNIGTFKSDKDEQKGADIFEEALIKVQNEFTNLNEDEYLVNMGFGGGSWFKIKQGFVPKFEKRGRQRGREKILEAAHTTVTINAKSIPLHIGWCKLKIEED